MSGRWSYHDAAHLIPVDAEAERDTAGIAIVSGEQAEAIIEMTGPDSFHDPVLYEIVVCAAQLPGYIVDGDEQWAAAREAGDHRLVVHEAQARAEAIAEATGIELAYLTKLVVERGAVRFTDDLRDRLDEASVARIHNRWYVDQLAQHGVDVAWLTELDARLNEIAMGLLQAATGVGALLSGHGSEADVIDALLDAGLYVGVGRDEIAEAVLAATERGDP